MSVEFDPTDRPPPPRTAVPLRVEQVVMAAAMAGIALITFANVATRYTTNISLAFTEEYSIVLMVVVTLVGSAYALAANTHIRIGYFADRLRPSRQRILEIVVLLLTILCFGILAVYGGRLAYDEYRFEVTTSGLGEPQWIFTSALPLLSFAVIARALGRLVRVARGAAS